jgi:hypothetical protein
MLMLQPKWIKMAGTLSKCFGNFNVISIWIEIDRTKLKWIKMNKKESKWIKIDRNELASHQNGWRAVEIEMHHQWTP